MKLSEKFSEKDIIEEYQAGINKDYTKKRLIRETIIRYNPETKKGRAIDQILNGIKRLL